MRIHDLLVPTNKEPVQVCDQFIAESGGLPLYRNLPIEGDHARRVKVRQRKQESSIGEVFNAAFKERARNLYQRAIFATTEPEPITETTEPFYIFPLNGYQYIYCTEVTKSESGFQKAFDTLIEQFGDSGEKEAIGVLKDLLAYSYTDNNLNEGIVAGSEIIIYNTPSYIAVRCSSVEDYQQAIEMITT